MVCSYCISSYKKSVKNFTGRFYKNFGFLVCIDCIFEHIHGSISSKGMTDCIRLEFQNLGRIWQTAVKWMRLIRLDFIQL